MMASSNSEHRLHKASLSVSIGGISKQLTIFRWLQVSELKTEIYKLTGIPASEQRLYTGHVELSNSRSLEDYSLFDSTRKLRSLVLEFKRYTGSFLRLVPGALCSKELSEIILEVNRGLKLNLAPQLTWDGTGGTYLMKNAHRDIRGVFKPIDEEAYAPYNPRGYVGALLKNGIRSGILSGESAYREVAAYLIDHNRFSGVPATALAESQHQSYNYPVNEKVGAKKGSFQEFIKNKGAIEDFAISLFSNYELQKIAILDMRILNMDRNEGNILVGDNGKLIPIDHGLSIPDCFDINEYDVCWMNWQQCKEPIDQYCLDFINAIDPLKDIGYLKEVMPFRDICLRNIRISSLLLKKGAAAGLTLSQIGSILYREGYEQTPSLLEQVVSKAKDLYKTINKSLTSRLKLEKCLSKKETTRRQRAYSTNEVDYMHFGDSKTQCSTPGELDLYEMVMTISEVQEEEEADDSSFEIASGRSLSLPCFAKLHSTKSDKEKNEAFDKKLFYYIEAFIELAIQKKEKEIFSNFYLECMNANGRIRSVSDVNYNEDMQLSLFSPR